MILFAFLLTTSVIIGQSDYKAENEGWLVDLEEAYQESKETGKPIMANFTGSDWCGWCKKLTRSVFSQPEFDKWAEDNVVLLELDFPRRKQLPANIQKQNNNLRNAFRVSGYPTVWLFHVNKDTKGEYNIDPVGRAGYTKTVGEFTSSFDQMMTSHANASK